MLDFRSEIKAMQFLFMQNAWYGELEQTHANGTVLIPGAQQIGHIGFLTHDGKIILEGRGTMSSAAI